MRQGGQHAATRSSHAASQGWVSRTYRRAMRAGGARCQDSNVYSRQRVKHSSFRTPIVLVRVNSDELTRSVHAVIRDMNVSRAAFLMNALLTFLVAVSMCSCCATMGESHGEFSSVALGLSKALRRRGRVRGPNFQPTGAGGRWCAFNTLWPLRSSCVGPRSWTGREGGGGTHVCARPFIRFPPSHVAVQARRVVYEVAALEPRRLRGTAGLAVREPLRCQVSRPARGL